MKFKNVVHAFAIYTAVLLFGLFAYLSSQVFIADSEFWSVGLGYHFISDLQHDWVYSRPLYYFLLWLSQIFYSGPTMSILAARGIFVLNTLLIGWLFLRLSEKRTGSKIYGVIAFVLLLGNTGFMNQGFRVRSDLLTSSLTLVVLALSFERTKMALWKTWVLCFLPLLATPKAILNSGALIFRNFKLHPPKRLWIWVLGFLTLALVWLAANINNLSFIAESLQGQDGPRYFSRDSYLHIANQFLRNPLFWLLFFLRFALTKDFNKVERADLAFNFILFLIMILAPEKTQFFIAGFLPLFALQAGLLLFDLSKSRFKASADKFILFCLIVSLANGGLWFMRNAEQNSNALQLKSLESLHVILQQHPEISLYDFACLLPDVCLNRRFVGPHQKRWNEVAMKSLIAKPPDVILYLRKASFIGSAIDDLLSAKYLHYGKGLFVRQSQNDPAIPALDIAVVEKLESSLANPLDSLFGYDVEY